MSLAAAIAGHTQSPETSTTPDRALNINLRLRPTGSQHVARVRHAIEELTTTLERWFGQAPIDLVTVIERHWRASPDEAAGGKPVVLDVPWWLPANDRTLEREIAAAMAQWYWSAVVGHPETTPWLREALAIYTGNRLAHEHLEGRHFHTERLFGGFLSYVVRPLLISTDAAEPRPRLRQFDAWGGERRRIVAEASLQSHRLAAGLHTFERYIGWPMLQQALSAIAMLPDDEPLEPDDLTTVFNTVSGRDTAWFFDQVLDLSREFDYAIEWLQSERGGDGAFVTTVSARRIGDGVFSGTGDRPIDGFEAGRAMVVAIHFADGTTVRERWDGRADRREFRFESRARAVSAYVDPDLVLLLDANRFNNGQRLDARPAAVPVRWSLQWLTWLQDLMLMTTALA